MGSDTIYDFAIYAIVFSVVGARLYYVICSWDAYKDNLWSILNLRGGGIAIYGAVIGGVLTAIIYCKIKKINLYQLLDVAVLGLLIGQIIGRYANFMNREAFGGYTDSLFAMRLPLEISKYNGVTQTMVDHMIEGTNYIQIGRAHV